MFAAGECGEPVGVVPPRSIDFRGEDVGVAPPKVDARGRRACAGFIVLSNGRTNVQQQQPTSINFSNFSEPGGIPKPATTYTILRTPVGLFKVMPYSCACARVCTQCLRWRVLA